MSDLSRVEQLLKNILGEDVQEVVPQSRAERILRAISGEFYAYSGSGTLQPYE